VTIHSKRRAAGGGREAFDQQIDRSDGNVFQVLPLAFALGVVHLSTGEQIG
jgi:hypothetical protein